MHVSETKIQVRYAETDGMQIVHHANYLVWFELGRTHFMEELGFHYARLEEQGFLLPVLDIHAGYKKPFRYGEKAVVRTTLKQYDGLRIMFHYQVLNAAQEVCVEGSSSHVMVMREGFRPVSLKKHLPQMHAVCEQAKS